MRERVVAQTKKGLEKSTLLVHERRTTQRVVTRT